MSSGRSKEDSEAAPARRWPTSAKWARTTSVATSKDAPTPNEYGSSSSRRWTASWRRGRAGPPFLEGRGGSEVALRRLVIFVDDLDRCTDEPTVRLLEAIKLYLQTRNCVFVFGMDASAARRAIARQLPHGREEAQEYLEKLFQAVVHVPVPSDRTVFLRALLDDPAFADADLGVNELVQLVDALVEPNPRKLKNFIGGLRVSWRIYRRSVEEALRGGGLESFVLLHYLVAYHPDVARLVAYDPTEVQTIHRVLTGCSATGSAPSASSPPDLLVHRRFRHAFRGVASQADGGGPDEVVADLVERLDRSKGDRAFVERWTKSFRGLSAEEVQRRLEPMLHFALASEGSDA